ncbi:MAG: ATP-binding protein [Pseudomonadota bacterium]|nr:ATP-binding protein [Pseudomonadota bacterium]
MIELSNFLKQPELKLRIKDNIIVEVLGDENIADCRCSKLLNQSVLDNFPFLYDLVDQETGRLEMVQLRDGRYVDVFFQQGDSEQELLVLLRDVSRHALRILDKQQLRNELDIAKTQLVQQQEALKQAHQLQSRFISSISHEFRTPLTTIIGHCDLLEKQSEQGSVSAVRNSAFYLVSMVNNILDYASMSEKGLEEGVDLVKSTVQTATLFEEISDIFTYQAAKKNLGFNLSNQTDIDKFITDPMRLTQCLVNLIGNAIKYTEQGQVSLTLGEEDEHLIFSVTDSGLGLTAEEIRKIFDPFYRVKSNSKAEYGAGLGLTITQNLAEKLDGKLSVQSEKGVGSVFILRIPLERIMLSEAEQDPSAPFNAKSLLLIEDNSEIQMFVEAVLSEYDLAIHVASSGEEGIALATEHQPDLAIIDFNLPGISGIDAAQEIRQLSPNTKLLGSSASIKLGKQLQSFPIFFDDILSKPYTIGDLLTTLRKLDK